MSNKYRDFQKIAIVLMATAGLSAGYMTLPKLCHSNITYASRRCHRRVPRRRIIRRRIHKKHIITKRRPGVPHNSRQQLYLNRHAKGIIRLSKPLRVEDSRTWDQPSTIPKGQVLHYQKQNDGVIVWNHRYPNNDKHQYEANGNLAKDQVSHDAKNDTVEQSKGMPNINKANAKKRASKPVKKPKLPRTSDKSQSKGAIFIAIIGLIIGIDTILSNIFKSKHKKEA